MVDEASREGVEGDGKGVEDSNGVEDGMGVEDGTGVEDGNGVEDGKVVEEISGDGTGGIRVATEAGINENFILPVHSAVAVLGGCPRNAGCV